MDAVLRFATAGRADTHLTILGAPGTPALTCVQRSRRTVTTATEITPTEQADGLANWVLVDACAHCADRRDAAGQKSLSTETRPSHP